MQRGTTPPFTLGVIFCYVLHRKLSMKAAPMTWSFPRPISPRILVSGLECEQRLVTQHAAVDAHSWPAAAEPGAAPVASGLTWGAN